MSKDPKNRYQALLDDEMLADLEVALPKKMRVERLSQNEADDLYCDIMTGRSTTQKSLPCGPSCRLLRFYVAASLVIGALIASLVVYYFIPPKISPPPQTDTKEVSSPIEAKESIRLLFNVVRNGQERPLVAKRGVPGEKYVVEDDILLKYQLTKAGYVCLAHRQPSGKIKIINKNSHQLHKAGWHKFEQDGRIMAVSLAGLPGSHSFYALYSSTPLDCLEEAKKVGQGSYTRETIVDSFLIEVE
jgi:hypothetical protein